MPSWSTRRLPASRPCVSATGSTGPASAWPTSIPPHGHGDHWFGTAQLLDRFPGAAVYATEGTIRLMRQQATTGREQTWDKDFPGLIPDSPVLAQPIPPGGFTKTTAAAHPYAVVARRQATTGHPRWALADASEAVAS